ncbi:MAG TPA: hypothetical protein VFN92_03320 [Solirubrobacterales bacterium]|nr:hypothetical protein [Solirubrobacterales bacterium]
MSDAAAVIAWVLLGVLYLAYYLVLRQREVRAAWARRAEGNGWSWKLLIPRPEQPWMAWATFGVYGLIAAFCFIQGTLWLAVPSIALSLIGLAQGIWGEPPERVVKVLPKE